MRLSRLFGGGKADEPKEPEAPEAEVAAESADGEAGDDYEGVPEGDPDVDPDQRWHIRAADVIPGGASTGSKRPSALYGEGATFGPTHYSRASGCHIITAGGRTLIDCTMALGSVAIGYADEAITRSVLQAAAFGQRLRSLAHERGRDRRAPLRRHPVRGAGPVPEVGRRGGLGGRAHCAAVHGAEQDRRVRLLRLARLGERRAGVPASARSDVARVPFDDVAALERACQQAGSDLAAIVIEPVIERLPSREWLEAARRLADAAGAVARVR